MNRIKSAKKLLFAFTIVVYTIALLVYGFWDYSYRKNEIIEKIDIELYHNAVALKYILPEDLHDRAIDGQAISEKEDKHIADKLTKLIKETDFKYTYTIIKQGGKLFFVASDISADPETKRGTFYFYHYEQAHEDFINAFDKEQPSYKTVSDKWGMVRTVMVPEKSPGGVKYLACVDYDISYVNEVLHKNLLRSIATVFFFLVLSVPFIIIYKKQQIEYFNSLRESEEKYRQIYESILDVYYETALDGTILEISPSIEKYSPYKREELIGKSIYDIYSDPADRDNLVEAIINKGSLLDYELNLTDKNGAQFICSLNIELIKDFEGAPKKIVGICRDISDRKKNEAERIRAQKIASEHEKYALVGQIAGKMAHDFNNILATIMGNTELALLDCTDTEISKTLELIFNQSVRGKNLTRNLVAFAKDQEPKQEFFPINDKIELVMNLLQKELDKIDVIKECGSDLPEMLADPGMIEHALVNLVQNSIHATSMVEKPKIVIRSYQQDNSIGMEIEDNGCGIPGEYLGKIFEPSFTLKGSKDKTGSYSRDIKGTGYGMFNVKKYVDQHKGEISVVSTVGKGAKIIIRFPVIKKVLTDQEIEEVQQENFYCEKYILLVEDEQAISDVQYHILSYPPCNHKVDVAANGQTAMDWFDKNKYDFISLDYQLPGVINGMDVYHHIRGADKSIPILFVSGNLEFLESIKALQQKDLHIDHLSKPCQNKDYIKSINKLMGA